MSERRDRASLRLIFFQVRASQAPARDLTAVMFVDSKGRPTYSGFDKKHKKAFGKPGKQFTVAERKRLEEGDYGDAKSSNDLASKTNGRWCDEMVELMVAQPSAGDTLGIHYPMLAHQVQMTETNGGKKFFFVTHVFFSFFACSKSPDVGLEDQSSH